MSLKFGTSGLRGLVTEMTDRECVLYTRAFARHLMTHNGERIVSLAGDLRGSTPRIMHAVAAGLRREGFLPDFCGQVPTPCVAFHAMSRSRASIMVTGSHIPDDRNGIKFNMPWGEVLKDDEQRIASGYETLAGSADLADDFDADGSLRSPAALDEADNSAVQEYVARYLDFFPSGALEGYRLAFYEHSSVARDILPNILRGLGAEVLPIGRSDAFVAVDTEAVEDAEQLRQWVRQHRADALLSTDGDGDRPLLVDEQGTVVRGDKLGILAAGFLDADTVATPVSCNSAVEKCERFRHVLRTRIGSPYVIAAMQEALATAEGPVVGFEANGGFLTATDIPAGLSQVPLKALPTRDAALPMICALLAARKHGLSLSGLVAALPPIFTDSGLLRDFPSDEGAAIVECIRQGGTSFAEKAFASAFGQVHDIDLTDGARMTFDSGAVIHLRPSGNAPEFRCYAEASSPDEAAQNVRRALDIVRTRLWGGSPP